MTIVALIATVVDVGARRTLGPPCCLIHRTIRVAHLCRALVSWNPCANACAHALVWHVGHTVLSRVLHTPAVAGVATVLAAVRRRGGNGWRHGVGRGRRLLRTGTRTRDACAPETTVRVAGALCDRVLRYQKERQETCCAEADEIARTPRGSDEAVTTAGLWDHCCSSVRSRHSPVPLVRPHWRTARRIEFSCGRHRQVTFRELFHTVAWANALSSGYAYPSTEDDRCHRRTRRTSSFSRRSQGRR